MTGNPRRGDDGAGHAFYTRRTLQIYDALILGWFSRTAWRCPAGRIVDLHDRHVTGNHLDIGAGTGYFLDECRFPVPDPRVVLLDPNPSCLEWATSRLVRLRPTSVLANALEPFPEQVSGFESVSLTYLLHCLPGPMASKAIVLDHAAAALVPGGVIFGATLLHGGVRRNRYARSVMAFNNRRGIFSNRHDDLDTLAATLDDRFEDVTVEVIGCVATFSARKAVRSARSDDRTSTDVDGRPRHDAGVGAARSRGTAMRWS